MPLRFIELQNIRLIAHAAADLDPARNVVLGANASGKTSFLEGIYLLGTGRSFRTGQLGQVVRRGSDVLRLVGRIEDSQRHLHTVGFQREGIARTLKVDDRPESSAAALAALLPMVVIAPETHYAFLHDAEARRAALNWGLFHVEPDFYPRWRLYYRLLKQRNSALKQKRPVAEFTAWDSELVRVGGQLHAERADYLMAWASCFKTYVAALLNSDQGDLLFQRGWPEGMTLGEALLANRERDRQAGYSQIGPHRADLQVQWIDSTARAHGSHGQQKLLVMALRLAQLDVLRQKTGTSGLLLVDDLAAELDRARRRRALDALGEVGAQIIVTATDEADLDIGQWSSPRVFHVERGALRRA